MGGYKEAGEQLSPKMTTTKEDQGKHKDILRTAKTWGFGGMLLVRLSHSTFGYEKS